MEIPQSSSHVSARDIDYLFEFSPETGEHQLDDTCLVVPVTGAVVAGAAGGETQSVAVHRGVNNTSLTLKVTPSTLLRSNFMENSLFDGQ